MKLMISVMVFLYFIPFSQSKTDEFGCEVPSQPKWVSQYHEDQKKNLDIEKSIKDGKLIFEISGAFEEKPQENASIYNKYKNKTSMDIVEKWYCNEKNHASLDSITGKITKIIEWKIENDEEKRTFYSKGRFKVEGSGEIKHETHESEKYVKIHTPWLKKKFSEELEWEQTWNSNIPTIKGELEMEESSEIIPSEKMVDQQKILGELLVIDSMEPLSFKSGSRYTIITEKNAKLDGPEDPTLSTITQTIKRWNGETLGEERELKHTESNYHLFNETSKIYELLSYKRITDELIKNIEEKRRITSHLIETGDDLNNPPQKSSYWKETIETTKTGRFSSFTINSNGHDILPPLLGITAKNGSFTRITDYNSLGRITRFLLIYFPSNGKKNETLLDIKFDDFGNLKEMETRRDLANINLNEKKDLLLIQEKIAQVKKVEMLTNQNLLPSHTPIESDFPVLDVEN